MTEQISLRKEQKADYHQVYELNTAAFGQEDEAKLVDALRKNVTAFVPELSIVATINDSIVGHILFTKITIESENGQRYASLSLAPMAAEPGLQKRGIGGMLIRGGFEAAKKLGFESVIVLGHEHYYPKFGFEPAEKWNIKAPFDVPSNAFMAIELVPGGLSSVSGTVKYPEEFGSV